jgi:predicted metal-dependent HD superfamily phosphohydrolase
MTVNKKFSNLCRKYFGKDWRFVHAILINNYSSHTRFYHTINHVVDMINFVDDIKSNFKGWFFYKIKNYQEIKNHESDFYKTIIFHDFVYEMKPDNELNSCYAFEKLFMNNLFIRSLFMATKHDTFDIKFNSINELSVEDFYNVLIHDADLYSMTDKELYIKQAQNVFKEYRAFNSEHTLESFIQKRKEFLEEMIPKEKIIFSSQYLSDKIKYNMEYELKLIKRGLYIYGDA